MKKNIDLIQILVPGMKQFKEGKTSIGLAWLVGALFGYFSGVLPGLIVHGIYVWKYFGKEITALNTNNRQLEDAYNNAEAFTKPTSQPVQSSKFNLSFTQNCEVCGCKLTIMEQAQKTKSCAKCEIISKGLINSEEEILFYQSASYKGGIQGFPSESPKNGFAFVLKSGFAFFDKSITYKVPYKSIQDVQLENFKMSGTRAVFAGVNARMLQETKNILAISYSDQENINRVVRFQIHGAMTIPGEAIKAQEFLNYFMEFKGDFSGNSFTKQSDTNTIAQKLETLKHLQQQGLINDEEFEEKKRKILDEI